MIKDDGKQWFLELTQSIVGQLKENREDIKDIWAHLDNRKNIHTECREHILVKLLELDAKFLEKFANLDKRLEVTIVKVGALISAIVLVGQYLVTHFFR